MLRNAKHVHMIGIGGIGMSGLARILLSGGCAVSGSDMQLTPTVRYLQKLGGAVHIGHDASNVSPETVVVVRSEAVEADNPEVVSAAARGLPVMRYAEALGDLMRDCRGVAVAGTHGKTTTTAMVAWILHCARFMPNFVIGGDVPALGGSSGVGNSDLFVAEACEYRRSFLNLAPEVAVINNIEEDHLDYYRGLSEIVEAFGEFAALTKPGGVIVVNRDDEDAMKAARRAPCRPVTVGLSEEADWYATGAESSYGFTSFEVFRHGKALGKFYLKMSGEHNVLNALAAAAVCNYLGVSDKLIVSSLAVFPGVCRRFEELGDCNGVAVVDDYAHHPTAVRATLKAAAEKYPGRRIWCVFQPHQHSRTRFLLDDFASSFADADVVVIPDIYFVRDSESERTLITSEDLVREITALGGNALYVPSFDEILGFLAENVRSGDLLLTMGAGDVNELAEAFVAAHGRTTTAHQ